MIHHFMTYHTHVLLIIRTENTLSLCDSDQIFDSFFKKKLIFYWPNLLNDFFYLSSKIYLIEKLHRFLNTSFHQFEIWTSNSLEQSFFIFYFLIRMSWILKIINDFLESKINFKKSQTRTSSKNQNSRKKAFRLRVLISYLTLAQHF